MRPDVVQYLRQKKSTKERDQTPFEDSLQRSDATCTWYLLDIKRSMATLPLTASDENTNARLRQCAVRMQSLWRMKVAMKILSDMRLNEMIQRAAEIKTLREREALLLARYNKYMDSEAMWHKRAEYQVRRVSEEVKTLDLTSVVDVDIMLDTSRSIPRMDGEFHNTGAASLQERCGRCSTKSRSEMHTVLFWRSRENCT